MKTCKSIPLLQISIPTYNRSSELRNTVKDLMNLMDLVQEGAIEIAVFDNSDIKYRADNEKIVKPIGSYTYNARNIGFGGNVTKCLVESNAEFTWVISDDDKLIVDEIRNLVTLLKQIGGQLAGVAVTCSIPIKGEDGTKVSLGLIERYNKTNIFKDLIDPNKLPFDYLGSFIIRTSLVDKDEIKWLDRENCYYQSLVYCTFVPSTAKIYVFRNPVTQWVGSDSVRWSVASLIRARIDVIEIVKRNLDVSLSHAALINEVLKWGILSKAGLYHMPSTSSETKMVIKYIMQLFSFRGYCYLVLYLLPIFLLKHIVLMTLKLKRLARYIKA